MIRISCRGTGHALSFVAMTAPDQHPAAAVWRRIGTLVDAERDRVQRIAGAFDLSVPQLLALRALDPDVPQPMNRLACAMTCDNSNVTGLVNRLEKRGLVERRADPNDRRVRMLALTDEGRRVRAEVLARWNACPAALDDLDPTELAQLQRALDRIVGG
jgi:DNA-binding MarR family transcriptional regulator